MYFLLILDANVKTELGKNPENFVPLWGVTLTACHQAPIEQFPWD